ncbi:hypothetical protein OIU84_026334 [Salix udensis]|uniref:Uncharacterized protein n=1 Tax=Salix udensis TaxID=889485 RepID=A0AAD6KNK3_9ROSI|nr:hypothetical protein OIU84_026334 [Salix udensis]
MDQKSEYRIVKRGGIGKRGEGLRQSEPNCLSMERGLEWSSKKGQIIRWLESSKHTTSSTMKAVPHIFTPQLTILAFIGRVLVGLPTILIVKYCSKALAKWILPVVSNTLGIPIKSTGYIPMLNGSVTGKESEKIKQSGYAMKLLFFSSQDTFDVDTGIRFLQYSGLAWSVVDLVPSIFSYLRL